MIKEPKCYTRKCMYYLGVGTSVPGDETEMHEVVVCSAFPNGIPDEIAYGSNRHSSVHPNQTGSFVFKTKKK